MKKMSILFLTVSLSIMLTLCLGSCTTTDKPVQETVSLPPKYEVLEVHWEDMPDKGGLFLSYSEYRKLAVNVENMRAYEKKLEDKILDADVQEVK